MYDDNGINRVLGVEDVLPVIAWKLDNSKIIYDNEMLLRVTHIHMEAANFKQICNEAMNDSETVKDKIIDLVETRGKLHNPFTDTGGLVAGTIERIGGNYFYKDHFKVGDKVLVLASATMIPLQIDRILDIDYLFGNIRVDGHAVVFGKAPLLKGRRYSGELLMLAFGSRINIPCISAGPGKKDFLDDRTT